MSCFAVHKSDVCKTQGRTMWPKDGWNQSFYSRLISRYEHPLKQARRDWTAAFSLATASGMVGSG
jgi:hypothetical protein